LRQQRVRQVEAQAQPHNTSYQLEKVRHLSYTKLEREYDILRARIRKIFKLPVEHFGYSSGPETTEFYRAYRLIEFVKFITEFRTYLIDTFNEQVMKRIQSKNQLEMTPRIRYLGKNFSSEELEDFLSRFHTGELTYEELANRLIF
jgi:hypothetical protein